MDLHILGMNGPFPAAGGACSGYFLSAGEKRFGLDLGAGTLGRLLALQDPALLDALLISHFHHDHVSDLGPLSYYLAARGQERPLRVLAPQMHPLIDSALFEYLGDQMTLEDVKITAFAGRHPVPTRAYRIEAEGAAFVYSGDTNTIDGLTDFCKDADLLLCDACLPYDKWDESAPHLSARHAAQIARAAKVKRLVLTHMSPLYPEALLLKEAREVFPGAVLAKPQTIYAV